MLAVGYESRYDEYKINKDVLINMIINQKKLYSNMHDLLFDLLTPLEKEFLKAVLDFKGCYLSNVSQVDNGKYITLFLPEFPVREYSYDKVIHTCNEFIFKRNNGEIVKKRYLNGYPRVSEFCDYDNPSLDQLIGCHNGFGWEIISAREIRKKVVYKEVLY